MEIESVSFEKEGDQAGAQLALSRGSAAEEKRGAENEETVLTIKLPISIKAFGAVEEGLRKQYGTLYMRPAGEGLIRLVRLRADTGKPPNSGK